MSHQTLLLALMPFDVFASGWGDAFPSDPPTKEALASALQDGEKREQLFESLNGSWRQALLKRIAGANDQLIRSVCTFLSKGVEAGVTPREQIRNLMDANNREVEAVAFAFQVLDLTEERSIHPRVWRALLIRWSLLRPRDPSADALWTRDFDLLLELLRFLLTTSAPRIQELLAEIHSADHLHWVASLKDLRDAILDADGIEQEVKESIKPPRLTGLGVGGFRGFALTKSLQGFENLNIFIGPNNVGKSSIMMALRRLSSLHEPSWPVVEHRWVRGFDTQRNANSYTPWFRVEDQNTSMASSSPSSVYYQVTSGPEADPQNVLVTFDVNALPGGNVVRDSHGTGWVPSRPSHFSASVPEEQRAGVFHYLGWHTLYVPSATTWGSFDELRGGERVYTRASLYEDVLRWKVAYQEAKDSTLGTLQAFVGRVVGAPIELLARVDEKRVHVRLDGALQPLDAYGDGLKQLLLIAGALHSLKRGVLLLEEPETALHPRWQRRLLNELAKHPHVQTFLTTHSNHFLDKPPTGCSIYRFSSRARARTIERMDTEDMRGVLDDIGARFSSLLLSNATIWVEGPTERKLINDLIKMCCEHENTGEVFEEGVHYNVAFLGGTLITKFDALIKDADAPGIKPERLCPDSFIISDADGFQKLEDGLWYEWRRDAISEKYSVTAWKTADGSSWQKIDDWDVDSGPPGLSEAGWEDGAPSEGSKLLRHIRMDEVFNREGAFTKFYLLPARELESMHTRERYLVFLQNRRGHKKSTCDIPDTDPEYWRHHYISDVLRKYASPKSPKLSTKSTKKIVDPVTKVEKEISYHTPALLNEYKNELSTLAWYMDEGGWEKLSPLLQELARQFVEFIKVRNQDPLPLH